MIRSGCIAVSMVLLCFLCLSCGEQLYIPDGDAEAGRETFVEKACHACHRVEGENFPGPFADPPVPAVLGARKLSRVYIAESILATSHHIAEYEGKVMDGELSRMGSYDQNLTLREWVDLVAYIESLSAG